MRRLFLVFLLSACFALQVGGDFLVRFDFSVSGAGNGEITVEEFPGNFSGQTGYCGPTKIKFPPYESELSCSVSTYPQRDLDYRSYEETPLTEVDSAMEELAREVARGVDFERVVALASWVKENVEYDLGVGDSQESAKWTFYNRRGTCDEIAHLLIALSRSAGITSRYVAGYVWDGEKWLPHAWAEVWTRYGWVPVDVGFDEYGYVDGNHIAVYKGADGDHNFLSFYHYGPAEVTHSFSIRRLFEDNRSLVKNVSLGEAMGNSSLLVELDVQNPFPNEIAFFPTLVPPTNFNVELLYPDGPVVLVPGKNRLYFVLELQRVRQNYLYTIPVVIRLGPEDVPVEFNVSGNYDCPPPREEEPYRYDVSGCIDLDRKGVASSPATRGNFFCGGCFYSFEEPASRSFRLDYPDFCEHNCTLRVGIVGSGSYSVEVNGESRQGVVSAYQELEFPLVVGENRVVLDGVERKIEVRSPPEMELSRELQGRKVCFESNWEGAGCYELSCGENNITLELRYGSVKRELQELVVRECNLWELFMEFLHDIISF